MTTRQDTLVPDPVASGGREDLGWALARQMYDTRYADLPPSTRDATKRLVLDTCGSIVTAVRAEGCAELAALVTSWGGAGEARIAGSGARVPAHNAALVNATMARALEIDDVHEKALLHATATMVPVALAVAEARGGVSGEEFLTTVAVGIDLAARLSLAPRISTVGAGHQRRPMSYTYQTGILVGALAAGRILGFDVDGLVNTLGIGYSQCAGNQQCLLEGAATVRLQQGLSSSAAVIAARMHEIGLTGTRESLEGTFGYFSAFHHGDYDRDGIVAGLGTEYETDQVSIKPYPCCKYTHTAVAAAQAARDGQDLDPAAVREVVVHVNNREYYDVVCQPESVSGRRAALAGPRGWVHAQFSLPYVVAVALARGRVVLPDFTEDGRSDPVVLGLMDKVRTVIDPDDGAGSGRVLPTPGHVEVFLTDRAEPLVGRARYAKGHPRNAMTYAEVVDKFLLNSTVVADVYPERARRDLAACVAGLDELPDVTRLADLLVAPRA